MSARETESSLWLMNAAVGLLLVVPLLLLSGGLIGANRRLQKEVDERPAPGPEAHDQPPIITISEAQVYSFATGEAELTPDFERVLRDTITPRLAELLERYRCDTVELVGHTDERPLQAAASNLDRALLPALAGAAAGRLRAGSNGDLGLMRAWSVLHVLRSDPRLAGHRFHAYSAGQTILPDGRMAAPSAAPQDDPARRRIEIRLRRSP